MLITTADALIIRIWRISKGFKTMGQINNVYMLTKVTLCAV